MTCFHESYMFLPKSHPAQQFADYFEKYYRKARFNYAYNDNPYNNNFNSHYPVSKPCYNCIGCRLDHANEWATRIYCETKTCNEACFVTFTYAPQNLPLTELGEATLRVEHTQKFWHDLRQKYPQKNIRYVIAGEYGTKSTKRPHYHACIFGYKPTDLKFYKYSRADAKLKLYKSKELTKLWDKGIVIIGELEYRSACYVARYVQKKAGIAKKKKIYELILDLNEKAPTKIECYQYVKWLYEDKKHKVSEKVIKRAGELLFKKTRYRYKRTEIKDNTKRKEEFILSSLRPAIGLEYWNLYKDKIKRNGGIFINYDGKVKLKPIPTYFKKKWKEENFEEYYNFAYKQQLLANQQIRDKIDRMILPKEWSYTQKLSFVRKQEEENLYYKLRKSKISARDNFA